MSDLEAADEIERLETELDERADEHSDRAVALHKAKAEIERLTEDRLCRCADEVRCEMKAEIERLQAVVDAAEAYFWASNLSQYDADSLDIQGNFEKALAALEDDDE
jgi:hypothetical protein